MGKKKKDKSKDSVMLEKTRIRTEGDGTHFLRAWRLYLGYQTHDALAEATKAYDPKGEGLARNVIGRLESGAYRLNLDHAKILSDTLKITPRDLIGTDPFNAGDIFKIYYDANGVQKKAILEAAKKISKKK